MTDEQKKRQKELQDKPELTDIERKELSELNTVDEQTNQDILRESESSQQDKANQEPKP